MRSKDTKPNSCRTATHPSRCIFSFQPINPRKEIPMSTMTIPNANGRKRPNLGEQINRLDTMLDGLSEALNDAVADAVKAAVGDAVQTVLTEVLTNPEIRAKLYPPVPSAPPPPAAERITLRQRLDKLFGRVRSFLGGLRRA